LYLVEWSVVSAVLGVVSSSCSFFDIIDPSQVSWALCGEQLQLVEREANKCFSRDLIFI
jgi:hypothetical protein